MRRALPFVLLLQACGAGGDRSLTLASLGSKICPSADKDPAMDGLQVDVKVLAVGFEDGDEIKLSVDGATLPATQEVTNSSATFRIPLADGRHVLGAQSADGEVQSPYITINARVAAPTVAFTAPAAGVITLADDKDRDARGIDYDFVIAADGFADDDDAVLVLTAPSTMQQSLPAKLKDGAATFRGHLVEPGTWTLKVSATGTCGPATFMGTAQVGGDPGAPAGLLARAQNRNTVELLWSAPPDGVDQPIHHCVAKASTAPILDAAGWDPLPTAATVAGVPPAETMIASVTGLGAGRPWYFGVRCFDSAGAVSPLATNNESPVTLTLRAAPPLAPTPSGSGFVVGNAQFGYAITGADLNHDGYSDLVVSAPKACKQNARCSDINIVGEGLVYVYMGGPLGAGGAPSFVLRGADAGFFGHALATLDWNHDGVEDLAVGAPVSGDSEGRVYIFLGGAARWPDLSDTQLVDAADADVILFPDQSDPFLSGNTFFGWSLDALDFDGDGRDDLAIGAIGAENFQGTVVLVFGPTGAPAAQIGIPLDLAGAHTAAIVFNFTGAVAGGGEYGAHLANLGRLGDGEVPADDTRDDLIVGPEPGDFAGDAPPRVFTFYGRPRPSSSYTLLTYFDADEEYLPRYTTGVTNLRFGEWLGSTADTSGDGRREVVITDPFDSGIGFAWIVAAGTPGVREVEMDGLASLAGMGPDSRLGSGFANPASRLGGDLDADGIDDLVLTGDAVYILYTAPGSTLVTVMPEGGPGASTTAAWVGDLDGDDLPDLAWGNSMKRDPASQPGIVQVLY